jgi:hypothetical protein
MRVTCTSSLYDLEGSVIDPDNSDLDGTFLLRTDDGELLRVNGWLFHIEIEDEPPSL